MLHQKIKQHIIDHPGINLADLSSYFSLPPEQIRSFLDLWVTNGALVRTASASPCQRGKCACSLCILLTLETYSWRS